MRRKNSKLFKAMMLSAMAMVIMSAQRASAMESNIYKCTTAKGEIRYQDVPCAAKQKSELLNLHINQSADIAPELRPLEMYILTQIYQRSNNV